MEPQAPADANELVARVQPLWTASRTRDALGVRSSEVLDRLHADGVLLGLTTAEGTTFYPVWQFRRTGRGVEVKPSLAAMFRHLKGYDPWTIAVLLRTPAEELGDRTPLECADADEASETLAAYARVVAREWSAGGHHHT